MVRIKRPTRKQKLMLELEELRIELHQMIEEWQNKTLDEINQHTSTLTTA